MKVVHIESGLGNQMLSYCELLALKKANPKELCYIETLIYDFPEVEKVYSQWNGYELERIFHISNPDIKELFTAEQWQAIHVSLEKSCFWEKKWNWPVYFCNAFSEQGLMLENLRGNFEENGQMNKESMHDVLRRNAMYLRFQKTWTYANLRRYYWKFFFIEKTDRKELFYSGTENALTGQRLAFQYRGNGIELIDNEIRNAFQFPVITDERNRDFLASVRGRQTVAVHARRGDLLNRSGQYYKGGFFRRSVKFIKKRISDPVFCFFCDPGSVEWCRMNGQVFGLDYSRDAVLFVDWNKGNESYRDMQLMSLCKHNIVTISSFGWWGAYLNENPDKITISPEMKINTTHHF